MDSVLPILKKELREIWRDPYILGVAILLPLVLLFLFAYAFDLDVEAVPLAVVDLDRSAQSRSYANAFANAGKFNLEYRLADPNEAARQLDRGAVQAVLVIPGGFSRTLLEGDTAQVQTLLDGAFPTSAMVIQGYVEAINAAFTGQYLKTHFAALGMGSNPAITPAVQAEIRVRYNPGLKSANFVVPGLIGVILMAFPPLLSALAIVRERERGSIQQIFVSPLKPWAFILGKLLPYGGIAYLELLLILLAARYWFGVPVAGNFGLFLLACIPYVISTVAIGLLVSTLTRSQLTAMLLAIVLTMMPAFIFSGFMYPLYTMPKILQFYSYFFPARYFTEITHDVFLRGSGLQDWGPQLAFLSAYALGLIGLASQRFKKKVS